MGFIWDFYGSPQQYIWWPAADIGREKSSHREVFFCLENHRFCLFLGTMVDLKEVCMRFVWELNNWFLILSIHYFIGFCTYFDFHLHWDLYLNMRNPYLFVYLYWSARMRSVVVKYCICIFCICICVSICVSICICICSGVRSSSGREAQPPTAACPHSVCPVQRLSHVRFYIFFYVFIFFSFYFHFYFIFIPSAQSKDFPTCVFIFSFMFLKNPLPVSLTELLNKLHKL